MHEHVLGVGGSIEKPGHHLNWTMEPTCLNDELTRLNHELTQPKHELNCLFEFNERSEPDHV